MKKFSAELIRSFIIIVLIIALPFAFPAWLFAEKAWAFFLINSSLLVIAAATTRYAAVLISQLGGISAFFVNSILQASYREFDVVMYVSHQAAFFLLTVLINFFRHERTQLGIRLKESNTLLSQLVGQKIGIIKKLISGGKAARFEELTILFSDIKNFTSLSEILPADILFQTINRYYDRVVEIVRAHQGVIDKFLGDGIMVVFGLYDKKNDSALTAVRCALQIQNFLEKEFVSGLPRQYKFSAGFGIATGRVITGLVGAQNRFEFTSLGDPVNLAARLERLTRDIPGKILVSEATWLSLQRVPGIFMRIAGYVKVRGRFSEEIIAEIFNNDEPELLSFKSETKAEFEQAVRLEKSDYKRAHEVFKNLLKGNTHDQVLQYYYSKTLSENRTTETEAISETKRADKFNEPEFFSHSQN